MKKRAEKYFKDYCKNFEKRTGEDARGITDEELIRMLYLFAKKELKRNAKS